MCLFMISSTVGVATRSAYQPSKYSADRGIGGIGSLYRGPQVRGVALPQHLLGRHLGLKTMTTATRQRFNPTT